MKPTLVKTTSPEMARVLAKLCARNHTHEVVQGSATQASEEYPAKLALAIAKVVCSPEGTRKVGGPLGECQTSPTSAPYISWQLVDLPQAWRQPVAPAALHHAARAISAQERRHVSVDHVETSICIVVPDHPVVQAWVNAAQTPSPDRLPVFTLSVPQFVDEYGPGSLDRVLQHLESFGRPPAGFWLRDFSPKARGGGRTNR